jgi:hypothetical protein
MLKQILSITALLALALPASADWRKEDTGKLRIGAKGDLKTNYRVNEEVSVKDLGAGRIVAQADMLGFGNAQGIFGWYSYQTVNENSFSYESPRDSIRMLGDFRTATISDTSSIGDLDTAFGSVEAASFKANKDGRERSCITWRGYKSGNRTLLAGYVCSGRDPITVEAVQAILNDIEKR